MNIRSLLSLMTVAIFASWLVACGSGGSVSGAGGGGDRSSNLVVNLSGSGSAAYIPGSGYEKTMMASFSDFLISSAQASDHLAGNEVTVWDNSVLVATGTTDGSGQVAFNVAPNADGETYTVCVNLLTGETPTTNPEKCAALTDPITETDVLTVDVEENADGIVVVNTETSGPEPAEDNVALFEDEDHAGPNTKIIVCHKPEGPSPQTLSISENAVEAHLNHGDELGSCTVDGIATATDDDEPEDEEEDEEEEEDDNEEA